MNKKRFRIDFNSPIILWMAILSFAFLVLDMIFGKRIGPFLSAYRTSIADPMQYLRLFTHVLVHSDISHYTGNFMMILAIGPMVEEKYSSRQLLLVTICTAVITGLVNVLFFPGKAVLGASGIVFMLILLASFTNIQQGKLPITVPLVAILYIGNEVLKGLFSIDNISQISHIIGGICGALFGIAFHSIKFRAKAKAD
jgi:GlpG protein